jgi:hypothetical protein
VSSLLYIPQLLDIYCFQEHLQAKFEYQNHTKASQSLMVANGSNLSNDVATVISGIFLPD